MNGLNIVMYPWIILRMTKIVVDTIIHSHPLTQIPIRVWLGWLTILKTY